MIADAQPGKGRRESTAARVASTRRGSSGTSARPTTDVGNAASTCRATGRSRHAPGSRARRDHERRQQGAERRQARCRPCASGQVRDVLVPGLERPRERELVRGTGARVAPRSMRISHDATRTRARPPGRSACRARRPRRASRGVASRSSARAPPDLLASRAAVAAATVPRRRRARPRAACCDAGCVSCACTVGRWRRNGRHRGVPPNMRRDASVQTLNRVAKRPLRRGEDRRAEIPIACVAAGLALAALPRPRDRREQRCWRRAARGRDVGGADWCTDTGRAALAAVLRESAAPVIRSALAPGRRSLCAPAVAVLGARPAARAPAGALPVQRSPGRAECGARGCRGPAGRAASGPPCSVAARRPRRRRCTVCERALAGVLPTVTSTPRRPAASPARAICCSSTATSGCTTISCTAASTPPRCCGALALIVTRWARCAGGVRRVAAVLVGAGRRSRSPLGAVVRDAAPACARSTRRRAELWLAQCAALAVVAAGVAPRRCRARLLSHRIAGVVVGALPPSDALRVALAASAGDADLSVVYPQARRVVDDDGRRWARPSRAAS